MSSSLAGRANPIVLMIAMTISVLAAACGLPAPSPRSGVALYVRNAAPGDAWFAIDPPPEGGPGGIGFGSDPAVVCLDAAVGTRIIQSDRPIGDGGTITAVLASIDHPGLILSVDIGANGNTVIGHAVPAWWTGPPEQCRELDPAV